MLRLICGFAIISSVYSARASFRVVNGQEGDIKDFPYLASLQHRSIVRCGATIINPRTVITATHCFKDVILEKLFVRAGTKFGEKEGQLVPVKCYLTHPDYVPLTQNNDIAIVWTKTPLTINSLVKPINMAQFGAPLPVGKMGVVAGWGRLGENLGFPDIFHFALLPVIERNKCVKSGGGGYDDFRITDKMFCAGFMGVGGTDSCKSDSGGPFVVDNTLVGVVSFGQGCARKKFPGVYANVAVFRKWIDENLQLEASGKLKPTAGN
uniref:Venom polypeptide n=1 Tax=Dolopus genitalis TaxID=2488630 RepID=A0A3G5BIK9_DOLGE|nr:venom polypeptide [Dolopus genitalis]